MNAMKFVQWNDALTYLKKQLDETIKESKAVNSNYQTYLKNNPYKKERADLQNKRKELTEKILHLVEVGHERYDGKT